MAKSLLYTGTGDNGTTSLVDGSRIKKDSVRLDAYGTIDEFSSFLGAVEANEKCPQEIKGQIRLIQNELFNVGAYLATPVKAGEEPKLQSLTDVKIKNLEGWIDALDEQTPKIRAFVLPGGCPLSAQAHIARAVCRRAERRILALAETEYVDPALIKYVNRLSDYLFIAARYANFICGIDEIVWTKD